MRLLVIFFLSTLLFSCGTDKTPSNDASDASEVVDVNDGQTSTSAEVSTDELPKKVGTYQENPQVVKNSQATFSKPEKKKDGPINQRYKDLSSKSVKDKLTTQSGGVTAEIDAPYEKIELTPLQKHRLRKKEDKKVEGGFAGFTGDPKAAAEMAKKKNKPNPNIGADDAQDTNQAPQDAPVGHTEWNNLLSSNVSSTGQVNYSGFSKNKAKLEAYLKLLSNNAPQSNWSRAETMAYWINAYNAFTIKLIVDNTSIKSIMDLDGGKVWDRKWIKIGSNSYSLNNIENDILRPKYKDARIHFAVNCAAKSCPPILNKAWTASNLNANFDKQAKAFINNPLYNSISKSAIKVSKIFEWYAGDFGNLIDYLNKYSKVKIDKNAKVSYMEYDWALNK